VAILASRTSRPVRWRRDLRAACFWLALALGAAAVANEFAGPLFYALCIPPLVLALRELTRALRTRSDGRLAERVAEKLTTALGPEYVVLTEYAPRDGGAIVPVVVVGPGRISAIEPLGEDATYGCFNDGWHRVAPQGLHHLTISPSRCAREDASRVRSDISGGGHIRTTVEPYVLIERGNGDDCASSPVPVVTGIDALADRLRSRAPRSEVSARQVQAVADALIRPLAVAV
jgi:hypothetical protein